LEDSESEVETQRDAIQFLKKVENYDLDALSKEIAEID